MDLELARVAAKLAEKVAILVDSGVNSDADTPKRDSIYDITESADEEATEADYKLVAEVVEACSSIARLDLITLWEQIIFFWIIGDASQDLHSFSMHEPHRGLYSLAPIGKLCPLTATSDRELSLTLNGRHRSISRKDFATAMSLSSLKSRAQNLICRKFIEAEELWMETINTSPLSETQKADLKQLITNRLSTLAKI